MNKSKELDQFYTNKELAENLYNYLDNRFNLENYFLLEPSAGEGAFSNSFHSNSISIDIDPKQNYIFKENFLDFKLNEDILSEEDIFTIGNPPFGKKSSLAIKFFNKSAKFSKYIAFIIPKTFKKVSVQNKLDLNFHLLTEISLPKKSFIFKNKIYDVPCVFQIWEKRDVKRQKIKTNIKSKYFNFVNKDDAHFAIRRVGGLAGKIILDFYDYKESSHYYIQSLIDVEDLIDIIEEGYSELNEIAKNSAGNPSLSKYELIIYINERMKNI